MPKCIGVLTAGGDSPGLNAAIRGIGKVLQHQRETQILGFQYGFEGLMSDKFVRMDSGQLSGILTIGGTILGTSRYKPHKMPVGGKTIDMTDAMVDNYEKHHLDCLVCIGGGGTHKSAYRLMKKGLNIITLPKTIDNDVAMTDTTIGFDTALEIATGAIDNLHCTANSHNRIILAEIMGHRAGWLALGAGIAGGADVALIPEIPYDIEKVADFLIRRAAEGKRFSIVSVAEGAYSKENKKKLDAALTKRDKAKDKKEREKAKAALKEVHAKITANTLKTAKQLEKLTGQEARVSILGYLQRGGKPSAADRLLATRLGNACAELIMDKQYGVMVAAKGCGVEPVPIEKMVGKRKTVPVDHPWIDVAKNTGVCLGD